MKILEKLENDNAIIKVALNKIKAKPELNPKKDKASIWVLKVDLMFIIRSNLSTIDTFIQYFKK